jgi:hypothetical protein
MSLPRGFLDEIEIELAAARRSLTPDCNHTAALEELQRLALAVTHEFARPITVFDFIRSAATHHDRERRRMLVRELRSQAPSARSERK